MIRTEHLTKRYGSFTAVEDLSLEVRGGEIFGLLGPNGAGKTTTFRVLAGILLPTSGTASIDGKDVVRHGLEAKRVLGYIPDRPFLYEKLTGSEFLRFVGALYALAPAVQSSRAAALLERFGLTDWADELIENYSHGMKQRLVMCAALLHRPKVLVVDEPMVGLDPAGQRLVKEIFRALCRDEAMTVLLSTHTLAVAEEVCDRIGILHRGRLAAVGPIEEVRSLGRSRRLEEVYLQITGTGDPPEGGPKGGAPGGPRRRPPRP